MPARKQAVSPSLRLAMVSGGKATQREAAKGCGIRPFGVLLSFEYLNIFLKKDGGGLLRKIEMRDWSMDSGAFTAYTKGRVINLDEYIGTCKDLLAADPSLVEVFSLDVIDNWRAGMKNTDKMWAAGVPAIPTFHIGEPWDVLVGMARDYPKIALGGVARLKGDGKMKFIEQCFARVWPKRIHGLGIVGEKYVMRFPFHSIDASSWELAPRRFGTYTAYGRQALGFRGSTQPLRNEIEHYLRLEDKLQSRWEREMKLLETLPC